MTVYTIIVAWMIAGQMAGETKICVSAPTLASQADLDSMISDDYSRAIPSSAKPTRVTVVDDRCVWMPSDTARTTTKGM